LITILHSTPGWVSQLTLDSTSPGQTKTFYILSNTMPPCPSHTGEGDVGEERSEEWRESYVIP